MLVVAGAAGVGGAASAARATSATPRTVEANAEFTALTEGVAASTLEPFTLATATTITSVHPVTPTGTAGGTGATGATGGTGGTGATGVVWTGELCDAAGDGCRPIDNSLAGTTLASGDHTVRMTATPTAATGAGSNTATAGLVFAGSDSITSPVGPTLPGYPLLWWIVLAAVALTTGLVLRLAQGRRTRGAEAASVAVSLPDDRV